MAQLEAVHPPFDWSMSAEEIDASCTKIIEETRALLEEVASIPEEELTFENCIEPLMHPPNYKTNPLLCQTKFLQHCSSDAAVREAACAAGVRLSKERVAMRMHSGVYHSIKCFARQESKVSALTAYQRHFLDSLLSDYRRGGLELDEERRKRLTELLHEDSALCSEYNANITNDQTRLFFSRAALEGLPAPFLDARAACSKDPTDEIEISLKYPDRMPIMSTCAVASTRQAVHRAAGSAFGNNLELMASAAAKRKEIASLLGYASYADYVTAKRMTGSSATAMEFLNTLHEKLLPAAKVERDRLLEVKKEHVAGRGETFDGKLNAWDLSFYHNLLLKKEYGVDEQRITEYFPLDVVVDVTLATYQELLGLIFTELHDFSTWHEEVRLFMVHDSDSSQLVGHFYLDLHPRDGKYNHAAIFHLLKRWKDQSAVDCMLANLPAATGDRPALLKHRDVVTFFHEFGHIMHGLCSEGNGNGTHLAKCPRDFVEAPSQMLENWCWNVAVVQRLSQHYDTKLPLPEEELRRLIAAKCVNVSLFTCRQLYLSFLDMRIHTDAPSDLQALSDELSPAISLFENPPGTSILHNFSHLMNQYAGGYHGYLWSAVLSEDMFCTRFEAEGLDNKKTGMDYRKLVLAPGGVGSILEHVTAFLGRKPSNEPFLRSLGIHTDD